MTNQPTLEDILRARGETIEQRRQREAHGTLDPELIYALRRETEPQREARLERYRQEDSALRVAQATAPTVPVDWEWANAMQTLPIFSAVALSLGHDIEVLAPLHQKWRDRPFVEPPKDYALRIAVTHQAVRNGTLKSHSTSQAGAPFDVNADFADAQCWEISLLEFRHFCDAMGWRTPAEFRPTGYAPTEDAPQAVPAAEDAPAAPCASPAPPDGLLTAQIAVIFDGLPYTAKNWPKRLSDTKWVQDAKRFQGSTGGASSILCPAHLAKLIHANTKGAQKQQRLQALNRRFKNIPELAPWRDDWNKHYELFSDAD